MTSPTDPSSGSDAGQPDAGSPASGGWGTPPGWAGQPGAPADGPPPGYGTPPAQYGRPQSSEDTTWAVLGHLSYFVFPLIAPLVVYLVKKDSSPFVRQHAAEALNFHITLTIAAIVSAILILVIIGIFLLFAVLIAGTVLAIIAAVAAGKGEPYRYPLTFHFVS